ncbi:hypothetical protein [uncultured Halomonas sp.]|uniref:hypothetical protein n=1 Tax=uncultured Halomonas sp. TaxID=173971 RepID=UPI002604077A|nr:hypothetical protein [uncultured Halomonas sp.]
MKKYLVVAGTPLLALAFAVSTAHANPSAGVADSVDQDVTSSATAVGGSSGSTGDAMASAGNGGAGGNGGNGGNANLMTGAANVNLASGVFGGINNMNVSTGLYNSQVAGTNVAAHSNVSIGN